MLPWGRSRESKDPEPTVGDGVDMMGNYVTWEGLFWLMLLGGYIKMAGFIVERLSKLDRFDFLLWALIGFLVGGNVAAGYLAYEKAVESGPRIGVTEVYRPEAGVVILPEVTIEGRVSD